MHDHKLLHKTLSERLTGRGVIPEVSRRSGVSVLAIRGWISGRPGEWNGGRLRSISRVLDACGLGTLEPWQSPVPAPSGVLIPVLRAARLESWLPQQKVCRALDIGQSLLSTWERSEDSAGVPPWLLERWSVVLGCGGFRAAHSGHAPVLARHVVPWTRATARLCMQTYGDGLAVDEFDLATVDALRGDRLSVEKVYRALLVAWISTRNPAGAVERVRAAIAKRDK